MRFRPTIRRTTFLPFRSVTMKHFKAFNIYLHPKTYLINSYIEEDKAKALQEITGKISFAYVRINFLVKTNFFQSSRELVIQKQDQITAPS